MGLLDYFEEKGLEGTVSELIDDYFSQNQENEKIKVLRQKLSTYLTSKIKKTKKSLQKLQDNTKSEEKAALYLKKADLIMSNLYALKDFSQIAQVYDYESEKNIEIKLDETKSLKENANNYYKLYQKAKTSLEKTQEVLERMLGEKSYFDQSLYALQEAESLLELIDLEQELGFSSKMNQNGKPEMGIFETKIAGFQVYVGKNNKQNDYIISKLSRDEDLWFHTRLCAGSHVLLKVPKGSKDPDDKTIFECAKLAKKHSSGKKSSKVGVIYTKRRYLKKPPGASLGYVTYKNEKEIIVD